MSIIDQKARLHAYLQQIPVQRRCVQPVGEAIMSDQNQELREQMNIQMAESEDEQIKKNPNLERGLILSKRQQKLQLEHKNIENRLWTPGHTI